MDSSSNLELKKIDVYMSTVCNITEKKFTDANIIIKAFSDIVAEGQGLTDEEGDKVYSGVTGIQ